MIALEELFKADRPDLLVVAGDVDAARVRQLATEAFASWTGAPAAAPGAPGAPAGEPAGAADPYGAWYLFTAAFANLKVKTVSIIATLLPIYGALFAWLRLSEVPSWRTAVGGGIVVTGVLAGVRKPGRMDRDDGAQQGKQNDARESGHGRGSVETVLDRVPREAS